MMGFDQRYSFPNEGKVSRMRRDGRVLYYTNFKKGEEYGQAILPRIGLRDRGES
jgi:hypothetical protein